MPAHGDYVYNGLDFEYLVELSLIDFSLSRLLWMMCSNIEHAIKVDLNKMIMDASDPWVGDKCVAQCFPEGFSPGHDNPYTNDLQIKCGEDFGIWHVWELGDFQQQLALYNKGYEIIKGSLNPQRHVLFIVRKVRNAVSHGNCLMTDLHRLTPSQLVNQQTDIEITKSAMSMCERRWKSGTRLSTFQNSLNLLVVNNLAAVLLSHLHDVNSVGALNHCHQEVSTFIERIERHRAEYFGDQGVPSPRNQLVNQTLCAFTTLANGYLARSEEKMNSLRALHLHE